jgi:hypothetical protein
MKHTAAFFTFSCALLLAALLTTNHKQIAQARGATALTPSQTAQANGDSYVYADFETVQNNRVVSSHGGIVQLFEYHESTPSHFKGLAGSSPAAPELVRLKQDDPNRAAAFDYELYSPNQYAGVSMEVHGQADKDGKPVADDLSAYKFLMMQIYSTGVPSLRVEFISRGQGMNLSSGFPQYTFRIKPGFNTYKIPLGSLTQPSWVDTRVNNKDILKKLTSISLSAYCEGCAPIRGTVVVDNITFQK